MTERQSIEHRGGKTRRRFGERARVSVVHTAVANPSASRQPSSWSARHALGHTEFWPGCVLPPPVFVL
eukprot:scaffold52_cov109-Isochrysis_galbana.AAC.1